MNSQHFQDPATHIWLDVSMTNNDPTGQQPPVPVDFIEIRSTPIVQRPSDYHLAVARFDVDTITLPLLIPQIMPNQPDVNKTVYQITLEYDGAIGQSYITYFPQDLSAPVPSSPVIQQDTSTSYYYTYSYNAWVYMVNKAFESAYNNLVANYGGILPSANQPFLLWDDASQQAVLCADKIGYNEMVNPYIKIYFNSPLWTLFSSFEALYEGSNPLLTGENYRLRIYDIFGTNTLNLPTGNYLQNYQEYSTVSLWNPIQSLVFTSSLIPLLPSLTSKPQIYNSGSTLTQSGNNSNIQSLITDFEVDVKPQNGWRPSVYYSPVIYKLFDLFGENSFSTIQVSVYWKDAYANLHKFYLGTGCSANIKLLFRKKYILTDNQENY
jgi:hypothetical protein